jgi:hypothetical protein
MDLVTARLTLRKKIGNPTVADVSNLDLDRIINAAYREIGSKYPFNETRCIKAFNTVVDTARYQVPTDMAALYRVWDDTNKRKLTKRGVRYLASLPLNFAAGAPRGYVRVKDYIQLIPTPDAIVSIQLFYLSDLGDLVADEDEFVLPLAWHDGIILKARHIYYDERGDIGKAIYAKNEWKDWVSDKPSELDLEKDDHDDVGVILPGLHTGHMGRAGERVDYRHYPSLFETTE